jgi:hypothetical protein
MNYNTAIISVGCYNINDTNYESYIYIDSIYNRHMIIHITNDNIDLLNSHLKEFIELYSNNLDKWTLLSKKDIKLILDIFIDDYTISKIPESYYDYIKLYFLYSIKLIYFYICNLIFFLNNKFI